MKNVGLRTKLLLVVALFALGGVTYGVMVDQSMKESLEESDYQSVTAMRDLIADILPPPMYAVEAYSVAMELAAATGPQEVETLIHRWQELEAERNKREAFWSAEAERLGIGGMLPSIAKYAGVTGRAFFKLGNERLLPAVAAGKAAETQEALKAVAKAYYVHRQAIDTLVQESIAQTNREEVDAAQAIARRKTNMMIVGAIALLLGGVVASLVAQSVVHRTRRLGMVLEDVARGNLTARARVSAHDEIGQMAEQLNRALAALEETFRSVTDVARNLAQTGPALAHSSEEISSGAQRQAASLEETAASLEQITATVRQTATNAQQANELALRSRDVAQDGGKVVNDAVDAMKEVRAASRRIGDIITTIDEVALQTNLLALNAAVEAARAGELGRGFAVVAAEVGNLAQRSATAAKEVKALIADSIERVETGHELVEQSGRSLNEIIDSVKRVTDVVGEIAAAAREQSLGVDQVNQAVSQMDQVTQTNATQTLELSETADRLASSAERLQAVTGRFKIGAASGHSPFALESHGGLGLKGPHEGRPYVTRPDAAENDNHDDEHVAQAAGAEDFEVV